MNELVRERQPFVAARYARLLLFLLLPLHTSSLPSSTFSPPPLSSLLILLLLFSFLVLLLHFLLLRCQHQQTVRQLKETSSHVLNYFRPVANSNQRSVGKLNKQTPLVSISIRHITTVHSHINPSHSTTDIV